MFDFLFEFFSELLITGEGRKSSTTLGKSRAEKIVDQKMSDAVNHTHKAEDLRKNDNPSGAIEHHIEAMKLWEEITEYDVDYAQPAPASYRELSKMFYHIGADEHAVEALDIYLEKGTYVPKREEMEKLRKRLKSGDFRRMSNKYDLDPNDIEEFF